MTQGRQQRGDRRRDPLNVGGGDRQDPVRLAHGAMDYFVDRYGGDAFLRRAISVHGLRPADLPGKPARHRDLPLGPRIETLSHGLPPAGPALDVADANERRDWRIHAALAQRLHPGEDAVRRRRTGVGPDQYRLRPGLDDHRSVPVGLSVGALPHHQGGGEDAHASTCGATFRVLSTSRMASCTTFMPSICSCRKPEPSTSWIVATSTLPALYVLHQAGAFFVTRAKSNIDAHRVYSAPTDRSTGIICDQTISLDGFYTRQDYPELLRRIRFKDPESGKTLVFITNNFSLPAATICALYKSRWQVERLQVDQAASSDQAVLRHVGERGEDADLDCRLGLRPRRHRQEAPRPGRLALHFVTDPLDPLRENAHTSSTCGRRKQMQRFANNQPIEFIRFLTGH